MRLLHGRSKALLGESQESDRRREKEVQAASGGIFTFALGVGLRMHPETTRERLVHRPGRSC